MKDYYKVLGVPRNANQVQIKQAYRNLIKVCHPDVSASPEAPDWTRQLNEAYATLSSPDAKMSYDMELKLAESPKAGPSARQTQTGHSSSYARHPPRVDPDFHCERCGRLDPSLRIAAMWRVYSFINYSRKTPKVGILCGRCRVKESLFSSAISMLLGWWSIWGFFWTIGALFSNARGGSQPKENNLALLKAVAYQLYHSGRPHEAYEALRAAFDLMPDPDVADALKSMRPDAAPPQRKAFWERFRSFDLHPLYYHAPACILVFGLLIFGLHALDANSGSDSSSTTASSREANRSRSVRTTYAEPALGYVQPGGRSRRLEVAPEPIFSEPEQPFPNPGALNFSYSFASYNGTTAPLKVTTKPSDGYYVMKLVDWGSGEFVANYFINSGSTLSVDVPLGSYKLKFASGSRWYGLKHLFGPSTQYSYIPQRMDFYLSGDYAEGHRIELIPQVGGNLETRDMKPEDW
ncbi:MAG: hypothetical protein C5B50_13820 [Verrucomicrobia bacterium]|nr:MAG: hypothetical protein C5B50_13820 [Verrucomicrobiota bacterium]